MKLKRTPELHSFLSTYLSDVDADADEQGIQAFAASASPEIQEQVMNQAKLLLVDPGLPVDELGSEANRWFSDTDEARAWIRKILTVLEKYQKTPHFVVKDSNGTVLVEGDSVQVIRDLKVKGGASDLKRGTLIKKIHLIRDPENIECRVDGSTLVLKTCFLKKA